MYHSSTITPFILFLLPLFPTLTPHALAAPPPHLNITSSLLLPNLNASATTLSSNPPTIAIQIDPTHNIYFSEYNTLPSPPQANFLAAIIAMQTAIITDYFERRQEYMPLGSLDLDAFGVHIYLDSASGRLTTALAHRALGELGDFLIERGVSTARWDLVEIQGARAVREIGVGWIVKEY